MVASDDLDAGVLDPDAEADSCDEGNDAADAGDVGPDADGREVYTFSNLNDGWCGIEDDDCDGNHKVVIADPDLDPDGRCAAEADDDCIGK